MREMQRLRNYSRVRVRVSFLGFLYLIGIVTYVKSEKQSDGHREDGGEFFSVTDQIGLLSL